MARRVRARGRPILGAISGTIFGLLLGLVLWLGGLVPLDSPVVTWLPAAGLVLGLVFGFAAPIRRRRRDAAAVAVLAFLSLGATVAGEAPTLPPTLTGPCEGWAEIAGYPRLDPSVSAGVYRVPREGVAHYHGSIARPAEDRAVSGAIWLKIPAWVPSVSLGPLEVERIAAQHGGGTGAVLGRWGPQGREVSKDDTYAYDEGLTRWIPPGAEFTVAGFHQDTPQGCTGHVKLVIDASPFSAPHLPVSLGLTLLPLLGLGFAGTEKLRVTPSPPRADL